MEQLAMLDEKCYLSHVERTVEKLRAACLGQDLSLTAILPEHFRDRPPEEQAKQCTEQLLFALAAAAENEGVPLDRLPECRKWLQDVTLYLLEKCNEDDQNLSQLKRTIFLPRSVRYLIFRSFLNGSCRELLTGEPPELFKELDLAWICLLETHGLFDHVQKVHEELDAQLHVRC